MNVRVYLVEREGVSKPIHPGPNDGINNTNPMNESTETVVEGRTDTGVTNTDATNASGGPETASQRKPETATEPHVESTESPEREGLPLDQTFELLRNQRRRYILQYLEKTTGEVSLSELAEQIAAWENDKEVKEITSSERKRVYVGLYQCHLPKMDGMDVISFNKPRGLVELGENAAAVEPYLNRATESEGSSRTGPRVGLPVIGLTVAPLAILLWSQSMLPLALAVTIIVVAALGGITMLLQSDGDSTTDETTAK